MASMIAQLLVSVIFFEALIVDATKDVRAPTYVVNLDSPPLERWKTIAETYSSDYAILVKEAEDKYPAKLVELVGKIAGDLDTYMPQPYADELRGVAKYSGLSLGLTVLVNIVYDITAFARQESGARGACTSIVATATDGTTYHGRNLDYSLAPILRNLTVVVRFQRGGQTVYTGTTYAGFVGLVTGQRANGITLSLDERNTGEWWENIIEAILHGTGSIMSFVLRDTLANSSMDYESALGFLRSTPLIAPAYLILGGAKADQGAVITRDRSHAADVWEVGSQEGQWYLVETNYDHWKAPPSGDNRRDPAIAAMNATGQANINGDTLYKVLSTPPVLNDGTTYTTIMSAAKPDLYYADIRFS